ncbi:type II toxin-antitoxin system HicA family toxin [Dysgonomonas sp. 511]|nr:type II toxin-antitoxin system HicA family toxin [Dysgonomonas sp. 511]
MPKFIFLWTWVFLSFSLVGTGAPHDIYYSPISENSFPVGRHSAKEVPTGTVNKILR